MMICTILKNEIAIFETGILKIDVLWALVWT